MKKKVAIIFIILYNMVYSQENGFIVKDKDTIDVEFQIKELTLKSFGKIQGLQNAVKYVYKGEIIKASPSELNGFCINSKGEEFCFDSFAFEKNKIDSFLLRIVGSEEERLMAYKFYTSGFSGVNYNINHNYLIKKRNQFDFFIFPVGLPKKMKENLSQIVQDCPDYHEYVERNIKKIASLDKFEQYLIEYNSICKN